MLNIKSLTLLLKNRIILFYKLLSLEGIIWTVSLIYLASTSNYSESHFTICPLSNLGLENCPGCGLGRSVSMVLHGHLFESFDFHWLGIPALVIILSRLLQLIRNNFNLYFKPINKGVDHA
ncbi:DUF2752 domain-containing protein [Ignavibacterium sp.]|uniref:DUF2752 domain-containing protein n=1 Tax=Ignavibacterium TaxID=795750 RepID=UPI0025BDD5B0|nr:DUF2752 domain-containing protein [Ignavibacterium sp.]